ncbi:hypothetical protein [Actinoplanes sp. NPDC049599]|jgi:hypothetical protein|uniref:hypothetical protein n=1 Tax=Actinoplanes sp. NPDC049599 TaxID=3363903 RepID=UPI0037B2477E
MSAKKLGRFAAGLFVALGLAFGGSFLAAAGGSGSAPVAANSAPIIADAMKVEVEWH